MIRSRRKRWILLVAVGLLIAGMVAQFSQLHENPKRRSSPRTSPSSNRESTSAAQATAGSEKYVGSQACAACHKSEYESYLRTAHSRSFSKVDPQTEPADVVFDHAASGRSYEVHRDGSEIIHRESVKASDGKPQIVTEFPVKYLVGSGRHTRSYLIDDDGFLAESPITWYASKQAWDMSPGYDRPDHRGFERAADLGCLICHLGQVESTQGSFVRPKIIELAIGCERCHGPGGEHVAARSKTREVSAEGGDSTIVQPARLARDLSESICAECHLRGDATVTRPGRAITGFRPGAALHDFRIDYHVRTENSEMKVVGHVEQMRLSRCYKESGTMSCTTCHDPHGTPLESEKTAYFRERCLACHTNSCKLDESTRRQKSPQDSCVMCHMPQTDTDIRHVAFTHHRIGLHAERGKETSAPAGGQLIAMNLPDALGATERDRNLGLAYLELSDRIPGELSVSYRRRAFKLLQQAHEAGSSDGESLAALARIYWEQDSVDALGYASEAMKDRNIPDRAAANALFILGEMNSRLGNLAAARDALTRLVQLRRQADDWLLLGTTQAKHREFRESLISLRRAAAISPFREDIRRELKEAEREARP